MTLDITQTLFSQLVRKIIVVVPNEQSSVRQVTSSMFGPGLCRIQRSYLGTHNSPKIMNVIASFTAHG